LDVRGLFSLRALGDFELDLLTFFEGLEAIHLNGGEMRKQVLAAIIGCDEAESLRIVEPLDGTSCHENDLSKRMTSRYADDRALVHEPAATRLLLPEHEALPVFGKQVRDAKPKKLRPGHARPMIIGKSTRCLGGVVETRR
jgi:hypothetical protein